MMAAHDWLGGVGVLLATYAAHSTLLLGGLRLWLTCRPRAPAEVRDALLKAAIVGGLVTTFLQACSPWRPAWCEWRLPSLVTESSAPSHAITDIDWSALPPSRNGRNSAGEDEASLTWAKWLDGLSLGERAPIGMAWLLELTAAAWWVGLCVMLARWRNIYAELGSLRSRSNRVTGGLAHARLEAMRRRMGCDRAVDLHISGRRQSPMTIGVFHPRLILPRSLLRRLDGLELDALLAHELAHVVRRDPLWNLIGWWMATAFWFQPLNAWAWRRMRMEAEFAADKTAAMTLGDELPMARCLTTIGEWLCGSKSVERPIGALAVGVAAFHSMLGQRVSLLVEAGPRSSIKERFARAKVVGALILVLSTTAIGAPHVALTKPSPHGIVESRNSSSPSPRRTTMKATLAAATLATLISSSAVLADSHDTDAAETVKIEAVPDGMRGLSGLLQAQLVSTDIERGTFVARIASIDRLWKKNTAKKPEEGIGKAIEVAGVTGKWLDVLISMKNGDMIEFEARHVSGDDLTFIAEGLKKVDMTGVPEGLYGFRGILVGTLVSKDIEKGTLVFRVDSVKRTWPKNKAKGPEAAKGRAITVHGISGKWLDVALGIGQGDHLEIEAFHNSGDHLDFTGEWLKRVE